MQTNTALKTAVIVLVIALSMSIILEETRISVFRLVINEQVEDYNELVESYNELVEKYNKLIEDYNELVEKYNKLLLP